MYKNGTNGIEYENKKIEFSCFLKETKINKFNFLNNIPTQTFEMLSPLF